MLLVFSGMDLGTPAAIVKGFHVYNIEVIEVPS